MELGIIFAFCAALGFGTNQIFVRIATQKIPGPAAAFFSVCTGTVIAVTLALIFHWEDFKELPAIVFAWYLLLATLHHPLARTLNFTAISMIGASRAAPLSAAAPVFSAILAIALLGERPTILLYLGTLVVVGGMTLIVAGGRQASSRMPQVSFNNLGYLFAFLASCGFGAVSVVAKHINTEYSPALVTVMFSLVFGTVLLGVGAHRPVIASFGGRPPGRHTDDHFGRGLCWRGGHLLLFGFGTRLRDGSGAHRLRGTSGHSGRLGCIPAPARESKQAGYRRHPLGGMRGCASGAGRQLSAPPRSRLEPRTKAGTERRSRRDTRAGHPRRSREP